VASIVPYEYLKHVLVVPVRVADVPTRFVFDTGIGINLVSESLAGRLSCRPDGSSFTGQRMSGQEVTAPLTRLPSLTVGDQTSHDVRAGIFDMHAMAGLEGVEGFVSLSFFRATPVTIDYAASQLILEDAASLARRAEQGTAVEVQVEYDDCSTRVVLGLDLPGGRSVAVEVDTGSDSLILDASLAPDAGVDLTAGSTRVLEGTDETGHQFARYFATLSGEVSVTGAAGFRVGELETMFQKIIYEGLVGDAFLRHFTTTYDLANSRMIFSAP
jgi:Aspartyl protease